MQLYQSEAVREVSQVGLHSDPPGSSIRKACPIVLEVIKGGTFLN